MASAVYSGLSETVAYNVLLVISSFVDRGGLLGRGQCHVEPAPDTRMT